MASAAAERNLFLDEIDPRGALRQTVAMLSINNIHFAFDQTPLFQAASATIPTGHKVGLVGNNGTGKTTLFRLIRGELALDSGEIKLPKGARVGSVDQEIEPTNDASILETVLAADTERALLLAEQSDSPDRIAEIQTRLADIGAWSAEARANSVLRGLGFSPEEIARPCTEISGGWRMRVALAAILFACPDLLLLDEPSNFLDLEGVLWLQDYLARYPHTVMIISHDRNLLNRAVGSVLHLDQRGLTFYRGGYDQFARQRAERMTHATAMAKKQASRKAHLQSYVDRFRYKADKAKQAQSRLKMITRMELIAAPEQIERRVFRIPEPEQLPPPIMAMEDASTGYDGRPVLRHLNLRIDQDDRIALLGRNGEGKSTFAKLLSGRIDALSGRMTPARNLRVGYFAQYQVDELSTHMTPLDHLMNVRPAVPEAMSRSMLAGFGLSVDEAELRVEDLSGGQKARLALLLATLDRPHLLILDEPTNHLDMESREALMEALTSFQGAVILVSHDAHLVSMVADRLWLVERGTVRQYEGDLESYGNQVLTADKPKKTAKTPGSSQSYHVRLRALRADVRKSEVRVQALADRRQALTRTLARPELYDPGRATELGELHAEFAGVDEDLSVAESRWMEAQERLETAENDRSAIVPTGKFR